MSNEQEDWVRTINKVSLFLMQFQPLRLVDVADERDGHSAPKLVQLTDFSRVCYSGRCKEKMVLKYLDL